MRQLTESRQRLVDLRAVREEEARQLHSLLARQVRAEGSAHSGTGCMEGCWCAFFATAHVHNRSGWLPRACATCCVSRSCSAAACTAPAQVVEAIAGVEARQQRLLQRQEQLLQLCRQLAGGEAAAAGPADGGGGGQAQEATAGAQPGGTESTAAAAGDAAAAAGAAGDVDAPGSAAAAAAAVAAVRRRQLAASLAAAKGA